MDTRISEMMEAIEILEKTSPLTASVEEAIKILKAEIKQLTESRYRKWIRG